MTISDKQDSNFTGLRMAKESSIGVLPTVPVWEPLEPNEYDDFGGEYALVSRNPINAGRQRQKGTTVDLDAAGGFTQDFTATNMQELIKGFCFADFRTKGESGFGEAGFSEDFTADNATEIFTIASHGLSTGAGPFQVSSTTTLPAGLSAATDYWVVVLTDNTFRLATSYANATSSSPVTVAITDNGTGTHTMASSGGITGGANDEYHVSNPTDFQVGHLVFVSGFADPVNNGLHRLTAKSGNDLTSATDLNTENAPANAKIVAVGFQSNAGDIDVDASGVLPKLTSTTLDFTTLKLVPGEWIYMGGDTAIMQFTNANNNTWARIYSVAANELVFDKTHRTMVTESNASKTVQFFFGRVVKNEADPAYQVRTTYQLERVLGAPESTTPAAQQAEYLIGAVPDELAIKAETADKLTCEISFQAISHETRDHLTGVKSGTRPNLVATDAFNSSNDFQRIRMAVLDRTAGSNPLDLFAHITETEVDVNNNLSPNKAIGVLGAFDISAGQFEVDGSATVYFSTVEAIAAIRDNKDVTYDMIMSKANKGVAIDIPLIALGDGRAKIEQNEPIMLDLETPAAADVVFNHTILFCFFDYLPNAAS